MEKNHLIILIVIIFFVLLIIGLSIYFSIFYKKQSTRDVAVAEGYGYYSDPIYSSCITQTGNCDTTGIQKIHRHCVPHPVTNKGCIDKNGNMTFDTIENTVPCNKQCIGSNFIEQNQLSMTQIRNSDGSLLNVTNGSGCNKIISSKGIDYTNYFLGSYNQVTGKYNMKSCIPKGYQGYYQNIFNCSYKDSRGDNNCKYKCGQYNTLKVSGLFSSRSSKDILNYYPTELDQEGKIRHVCYNINDVNQIEILNSTDKIPDDFVYPDKCYQHTLKENNIGISTIYPIGTSNVYTSNLPYLDNQTYFEIDTVPVTVISKDYNIMYDYNNYSKIMIDTEIGILANFVNKQDTADQRIISSIRNDSNIINAYLLGNDSYQFNEGSYLFRNDYTSQNQTITSIGNYTTGTNSNISFNLNDILESETKQSFYEYNGTSSYIRFTPAGYLTDESWIYYTVQNSSNNYFKSSGSSLIKIEGILDNESWAHDPTVKIAYFSQDLGQEAALYGISFRRVNVKEDTFKISKQTTLESTFYKVADILISNNVLLKQPITANPAQVYPVRYDYNKVKELESELDPGTSFYYFGSETNTNEEGYYFPLYLKDPDPNNTHQHTFEEFPEIIFYMKNDERNHAAILPPDRSLNLVNFDEFFGFASVKFYNTNGIITEAQIYQNGNYDQKYIPSSNSFGVVYVEGNPVKLNNFDLSSGSKNFVKVLRSNNPLITFNNTIDNDSFPYVNKLKLYYDMIADEANMTNDNNQSYDIVVMPEKDIVLTADFTVFKSPFVQKTDGSLESFCFDQFGRPLPSGTIRQVEVGERIIVNLPCNNYNTEFPPDCNFFGFNQQFCTQTRESNFPLFKTGTCIYNFNNYTTYKDYLEFGLDSYNSDYELKCYDQNGNIVGDNRCFPIFFTKEYKDNRVYASNEEFFFNRSRQEYYLSLVNDNTHFPLNSEYWERVFSYQPNIDVETYQNFMIQENKSSFVFQTTNSGVMGENPFKLAVSYIYTKPQSIFLDYIDNHPVPTEPFTLQKTLPYTNYYQVYPYNFTAEFGQIEDVPQNFTRNRGINIKFLSDGLSAAGLSEGTNSLDLIECSFEFSYPFDSNKYNDFSTGDIFNPDFSFFNGWLNYINASAITSTRSGSGIITTLNDSILFQFNVVKGKSNDKFFNLETTTITYLNISSNSVNKNLKIGDYIYITPYIGSRALPNIYSVLNVLWGSNQNNPTLKFSEINPSYEVLLVREIDTAKRIITVERNILNQERNSFFGYNQSVDTDALAFAGYLLAPNFKPDLNYEITKLEDGKLFFNTSNYLPAYTIKKLKENILETGYKGNSFNTPILNYFYNSLTTAFSARVIKKNVTTPFITYGNNNLYLAASKDYTRLRSILVSIFAENKFNIFIEEYKDGDNSAFYIGDTIRISPSNFKLKIIDKDEFFKKTPDNNNLIVNKRFDYKCTLVYDVTNTAADYEQQYQQFVNYINNKFNNYTNYINNNYGISVASALQFYGKSGTIASTLGVKVSDPSPFTEKIVLKNTPSKPGVSLPSSGVSFNPYASLSIGEITLEKYNEFASQQVLLDKATALIYLDLVGTVIKSDIEQTVTLTDIQINAKPEGPTYLTNIATNNNLDRSGYGTVTSFKLGPASLISDNTEYYSPHGLVFKTTTKNIASYTFKDTKNIPQIEKYSLTDEYSRGDILEFTNPNERVYYLNTSSDNIKYSQDGNSWQQVAASFYNEDRAVRFSLGNTYLKNDSVIYEGKYYTAKSNNTNILPGVSTYWTEQDFSSQNDLISNENYFYSFGVSRDLSVEDLQQFKYQDFENYPLGVYNYSNKKSYCPQETIEVQTHDGLDYKNSFINQIDGICSLGTSMGEFFIINQGQNQVLSLITAPYTKDEFPNVKIYSSNDSGITDSQVSQYIYSIPLDSADPANSGRPFCLGTSQFGDSHVNYLDLANSVLFSFSPLKLEDQDYPSFGTCSGLSTLVADHIGQYSPNMGTCYQFVIDEQNYHYSGSSLGGMSTSYIQSLINFNPSLVKNNNNIIELKKGISQVNLEVTEYGFMPSIFNNPSGITQGASAGDPWYISDSANKIVSHGYINKDFNGTSAKLEDFSTIKYHNKTDTNCNLYMVNQSFNKSFGTNFVDFITNYKLRKITDPIEAGSYKSVNEGLSVYINLDKNRDPLQPTHYTVGISTPSIGLSFNENFKYYSVFKPNQLKTKLFGLFSSAYFGSIRYQLNDKFYYNNQNLPALIFKPYFNNVLSQQTYPVLDVINPSGTSIINYNDNYNTFIIENGNTNFNLKNNFYDKPVRKRDVESCNIIPAAFKGNQETNSFLISNSNKIRSLEFEDLTLSGVSFVGPLESLVPFKIEGDNIPTNQTVLFKNLRNISSTYGVCRNLNCNIYTNTINSVLPSGATYDIIYNQDPVLTLNYKKYFTSKLISSNTPITLTSNVTNVFRQSGKDYPITISKNPDITETNIIKNTYPFPDSSDSVIVQYYLNNIEVDYDEYRDPTLFDSPESDPKTVRLIFRTPIEGSQTSSRTLYIGSQENPKLNIKLNLENI